MAVRPAPLPNPFGLARTTAAAPPRARDASLARLDRAQFADCFDRREKAPSRPSFLTIRRPPSPPPPSHRVQGAWDPDRKLVSISEFGSEFKGARIQVLWPDTGEWYNAEVLKVNVGKRTATLWYSDSNEKEEIDLYEAILKMEVSWPKALQ